MSALLGWVLGAGLACNPAPPPPAAAPEPAPTEAAAPAPAEGVPAAPTPAADLVPRPPTHEGRVDPPLAAPRGLDRTLRALGTVVDRHGADPGNPWGVAHALLARGPELVLLDGRRAVDALFADWAEPVPGAEAGLLQFPAERGGVRVEPHSDLLLKTLADAGLAPDTPVQAAGQAHTLVDLWRGSVLRSTLVPATNHSRYGSPDDIAWSLHGLALWAPPDLAWTALDGTPMRLSDLADFGLAVLIKETRFLAEAKAAGQPFRRQGQGIFRYTCGGAHLLQGVALAVARGFGDPQGRARMAEQAALQLYRFPIEAQGTRDAAASLPEHAERLEVQRLKFAGHFLESMGRLQALGLWTPDAEGRAVLGQALAEVVDATAALQARGTLADLEGLRARDPQLYLDVVGDSAHALFGVELVLGRRVVRY